MEKEEKKSYALMYMICSAVLVLTMVWAIWNEVVGKRVWKDYQGKFYSLLVNNASKELEEEKARFGSNKVQNEYQPVKRRLEKAREKFKMSGNQNEFNKLQAGIQDVGTKELAPIQLQLTDIRNKVIEAEYLYTKHHTEEYKNRLESLKNEAKKTLAIVEKVKARMVEMQEKKAALTADIDGYEKELSTFISPINKLQEQLVFLMKRRPSLQKHRFRRGSLRSC